MRQVAPTLTMADARECRMLICDWDAKWSESARARLGAAGIRVVRTPIARRMRTPPSGIINGSGTSSLKACLPLRYRSPPSATTSRWLAQLLHPRGVTPSRRQSRVGTIREQLAEAFASNVDAYRNVAHAVAAPSGHEVLEHAIGAERVAQFLAMRLVALGATRVLAQSAGGAIGPEWVPWLTGQIQFHVPEAAGASARRAG